MNKLDKFHNFKETFEFYKNLSNCTDKVFKIRLIMNRAKYRKNKMKKLFTLAIIIINLIFITSVSMASANDNIIVYLAQFSLKCYPNAIFRSYNDKMPFGNAIKKHFRTNIKWKVVPYFKFDYVHNTDTSTMNSYICNYLTNEFFKTYPNLNKFGDTIFVCNKNITFNQFSNVIIDCYRESNNKRILYPVLVQKIIYKKAGLIIFGCGEFIGKSPYNNKNGKYEIYMTTYWTDFNRPQLINILGVTFNNEQINLSDFMSEVYYN